MSFKLIKNCLQKAIYSISNIQSKEKIRPDTVVKKLLIPIQVKVKEISKRGKKVILRIMVTKSIFLIEFSSIL